MGRRHRVRARDRGMRSGQGGQRPVEGALLVQAWRAACVCAALGALLTFPSNASVERVYSATGNAVTALRNRLSLENVGATVSSSRGGNYRATTLARRRRGSGGKSYFLGVFLQTTYILTYDESFLPRELRT